MPHDLTEGSDLFFNPELCRDDMCDFINFRCNFAGEGLVLHFEHPKRCCLVVPVIYAGRNP